MFSKEELVIISMIVIALCTTFLGYTSKLDSESIKTLFIAILSGLSGYMGGIIISERRKEE